MTIPLVFFAIASLVLWFIIGSKGYWALKAIVIFLTLYLCVSVGMSIPNFAGWPSSDPLPEKFLVHWIVIKEPDKVTKDDGHIYIWSTNLSGEIKKEDGGWQQYLLSFGVQDLTEPRAYRMPYTREAHERSNGALTKLKNGELVMGRNNGKKGNSKGKGKGKGNGKGDGKGKEQGDGKGGGKGGGSFSRSDDISFHDLPDTILPDKE